MHPVGADVVQQALIVGDHQHRPVGRAHGVDPLGDDAQGVDVEAGVGLVQDAQLGFEYRHLENLVTFLLAAGKAFVDRAFE